MKLDSFRTRQVEALLAEGNGIRTVVKLTGVSRNAVRRIARGTPPKRRFGEAWRAMDEKRDEVRQLFLDCECNCSAMLRFLEPIIGPKLPALRTLQQYCQEFRLAGKEAGKDSGKDSGQALQKPQKNARGKGQDLDK